MGRHFSSAETMRINKILVSFILIIFSLSVSADISRDIQSQIQQIFGSYSQQKSKLSQDKALLHQFVAEKLSPKLANVAIAKYLLGDHWKSLSKTEKQQWITTVTDTLIRYSMRALESYQVNAIDWNNSRFQQQGSLIKMTTSVKSNLHLEIPIDLLIKVHHDNWGILDISAINFSFLSLKSKEYQGFLQQHSFAELLASLSSKNDSYFCEFQPCNNVAL